MTSTPTRPVDNVVIATKGLQDRNINILAGTMVENKGKLILTGWGMTAGKVEVFIEAFMCLCVPFIQRSLNFLGKSFFFLFLFLYYPYFSIFPFHVVFNYCFHNTFVCFKNVIFLVFLPLGFLIIKLP